MQIRREQMSEISCVLRKRIVFIYSLISFVFQVFEVESGICTAVAVQEQHTS